MNITLSQFIKRMEEVTLSSNVYETYIKVFNEGEQYYYCLGSTTFNDIRNMFKIGFNLNFNISTCYPNVIAMFLYLVRSQEIKIMGKQVSDYFQELEDTLPLESWKKMLRAVSEEKDIVRRIIGGKGKDWDLATRPIYFHRNYMIIHLMDGKGTKSALKRLIIRHPDLFNLKHTFYDHINNRLHLRGNQECWDEYEEYMFSKLGVKKEDIRLVA